MDRVAADEVVGVHHAEAVGARRLEVEAEVAEDRRRGRRARGGRVDLHDPVAVDQRERLQRDVGLDVVAGPRVADLPGALALEHGPDHALVGGLEPRAPVDLAPRHHGAAGPGVVGAGPLDGVAQGAQLALEEVQQRAARAEGQPRAHDEHAHVAGPGRRELRCGGVRDLDRQRARAAQAQAGRVGAEAVGGRRDRDGTLGEHLAALLDADDGLLAGDVRVQDAGHVDAVAAQDEHALAVAEAGRRPGRELAGDRRGGRRRRGRRGRRRGRRGRRGRLGGGRGDGDEQRGARTQRHANHPSPRHVGRTVADPLPNCTVAAPVLSAPGGRPRDPPCQAASARGHERPQQAAHRAALKADLRAGHEPARRRGGVGAQRDDAEPAVHPARRARGEGALRVPLARPPPCGEQRRAVPQLETPAAEGEPAGREGVEGVEELGSGRRRHGAAPARVAAGRPLPVSLTPDVAHARGDGGLGRAGRRRARARRLPPRGRPRRGDRAAGRTGLVRCPPSRSSPRWPRGAAVRSLARASTGSSRSSRGSGC